MADSVEVSTIETTDGTIGVIRDNAARQSIANIREGKEAVGAVAWENVKDKPTNVSSFQNDKKYQTEEDVANTLNGTLYAGSSTHGGPATSADKLTTARTISLGGAASGSGSFDGSANSTINVSSLDATKLTGVVPITNLPPSVIERMSVVKDDTERFALTTDSVQDGDVVKVQSSNLMYYVVDDSKLSTEAGYEVFKAGSAASVPWGGVTGKPSTFPPSSHTHTKSQITDFPSSMPNPNNLTMQIEGNDAAVYNGGTAQAFNVTKSALGLDKVNNTADADKSVKYASSAPWIGVTGKPSTFPPSAHTHSMSQITDLGAFGGASATADGSAGLVPQPAAGDQDKYLSAKGTWESITGKISGTKVTAADTADSIKTYTTRPASANKLFGDGKLRYFLATSSMTEGKPPAGDAGVLDLAWDNDGGWDAQIAIPMPNGPLQIRSMKSGTWQPWKSIAYKSDIPTSLPASDVSAWAKASSKPSYSWSEITGKPSTFPPSAHTHNTIYLPDTRSTNQAPSWYYSNYGEHVIVEFKAASAIGLSDFPQYCALVTVVPWKDSSGGNVVQRAVNYSNNKEYIRSGSGDSWGSWTAMDTTGSSKSLASTLLASGWQGSAAPYTYDLGSTYSNKSVMIGYDGTKYSEDSIAAASDADIVGGEGTVIYAYGEKPTVDIPIIIQYS